MGDMGKKRRGWVAGEWSVVVTGHWSLVGPVNTSVRNDCLPGMQEVPIGDWAETDVWRGDGVPVFRGGRRRWGFPMWDGAEIGSRVTCSPGGRPTSALVSAGVPFLAWRGYRKITDESHILFMAKNLSHRAHRLWLHGPRPLQRLRQGRQLL